MVKKPDDSKIGGIKSTKETQNVEGTKQVGSVSGVKATSSIGAIGQAGAAGSRRATRTMTLEEREHLFRMVNEEADKLFANSGIPKEKQDLLQNAVKMAIDSGLMENDDSDDEEETDKADLKK